MFTVPLFQLEGALNEWAERMGGGVTITLTMADGTYRVQADFLRYRDPGAERLTFPYVESPDINDACREFARVAHGITARKFGNELAFPPPSW